MFLQPTFAINYYGSGVNFERIVPTGPHTTEIRYTFLFKKGANPSDIKDSIDTSYVVTQEDIEICEGVQKSFDSGAYVSPGPLSPLHENGINYFQDIIRGVHQQ